MQGIVRGGMQELGADLAELDAQSSVLSARLQSLTQELGRETQTFEDGKQVTFERFPRLNHHASFNEWCYIYSNHPNNISPLYMLLLL